MSALAFGTRRTPIAYWVTTALIAAELAVGGVWDLLQISFVRGVIDHLGYPVYLLTILGVWKVAGAIALLVPRLALVKEWAYAGAVLTYVGAAASHLTVGDGVGAVAPLCFAGLSVASWALRQPSRRELAGWAERASSLHTVGYWVMTAILATECLVGGVMGALRMEPFIGIATHLGFPPYFMTLLGIFYMLAGVTLLAPRFPLLKEWAYAGLVFNYTGAVASHVAAGDGVEALMGAILFMTLTVGSWLLRPSSRRAHAPIAGSSINPVDRPSIPTFGTVR
jgi:uncharacterized membrane protein